MVLVGYNNESKAYRCFNPAGRKIYISRDVEFNKNPGQTFLFILALRPIPEGIGKQNNESDNWFLALRTCLARFKASSSAGYGCQQRRQNFVKQVLHHFFIVFPQIFSTACALK
jgi:hypothetical protein